jgi:leucyl aminopeptidase (aminopeptidase T)
MRFPILMTSKSEDVMFKALGGNLAYRQGEKVVLVTQRWDPTLEENTRPTIDAALTLCNILCSTYKQRGIDAELFTYVPTTPRGGVEPTQGLYDLFVDYETRKGVPEIVIAPAAYSVTHTNWRKKQNDRGSRIATMSNASIAMFAPEGPFDVLGNYQDTVVRATKEAAENLRSNDYVRITGDNTDLVINVNRDLVHMGTGSIIEPGSIDNWLGAEAFAVPIHKGNSYGYFTTPAGWGGQKPFEHDVTFHIKDGVFTQARSTKGDFHAQQWIDTYLKPQLFNIQDYDVVAEIGIGTNFAISDAYLKQHWSIAVGEKKGGTVHIAHGNSATMGGANNVEIHQDFVIVSVDKIDFAFQP